VVDTIGRAGLLNTGCTVSFLCNDLKPNYSMDRLITVPNLKLCLVISFSMNFGFLFLFYIWKKNLGKLVIIIQYVSKQRYPFFETKP